MKYLDLSLATPAANLACDEALLEACEHQGLPAVLRVWESSVTFVVLGFSNQVEREVKTAACRAQGVPVLRRCSGGGTVVQGPGCLNYALCLPIDQTGPLATITGANRFIMEQHRQLFETLLGQSVRVSGHTDLAIGTMKFSGNAQRRQRRFLLFHGTILHAFDLLLLEQLLPLPSHQPTYRAHRAHGDFVRNLPLSPATAKEGLQRTWQAQDADLVVPPEWVDRLVQAKYSRDEWNLRC